MTVRKLPEFKGYVVDERLREFRKTEFGKSIEFIPFDSEKGRQILKEYSMKKSPSDLFEETCAAMGGEYDEEYGLLEPDVGGEFLDVHEANKQWCTFKNMKGIGKGELTVFNAPNTFSMKHHDENNYELFNFWDNDIEKKFDPEYQEMCFYSRYGIRVPKCDVCICATPRIEHGRPDHIWLKLRPRFGD